MKRRIEVSFFNGIEDITRVCVIRESSTHTYTHFFIYDRDAYGTEYDLYSGSEKDTAIKYMERTGNMTIADEEILKGV